MSQPSVSNLEALANLMPPKPFSLRVRCEVAANKGQTAELVKATPQGINPKILLLDVVIHGRGAEPGNIPASYEDADYDDQYDEVTVASHTVKVERVY
jgi:hypothetical protein